MIDRIVLQPNPERTKLQIDLYGDLAGILAVADRSKATKPQGAIKLVEGTTHGLSVATQSRQLKLVGLAGLEPATRPL